MFISFAIGDTEKSVNTYLFKKIYTGAIKCLQLFQSFLALLVSSI